MPQSIEFGSSQISLAALNIRQVGDLHTVLPLTILALAEACFQNDEHAEGIWPQALAMMPSLIAPVLEFVVAQPLSRAFALPYTSNGSQEIQEPKQHDQHPHSSYSALFFEPGDVLKAVANELPDGDSLPLWTPFGLDVVAPHECSPNQAPLLSFALQQALAAGGCDLFVKLDVLQLNVRTLNTCIKAGDRILGDLVSQTPDHLFGRHNFGPKSYFDVVSALRKYLAPWLANLSFELISGEEDGKDSAERRSPTVPAEQQVSAEPEKPLEAIPDDPAYPFAAFRDSDLVAALDLYGIPWRDISVGLLAPDTLGKPLAHIADADPIVHLIPPATSSPLEETNGLLREFVQLLSARGLDPALADLPAGALVEPRNAAADIVARIPANRADCVLHEIVKSLTTLLLKHVLRPDAFQTLSDRAVAALRRVTIADLLTEVPDTLRNVGSQPKRELADIVYVLKGLYDGKPQTLEALGKRCGVTRERIRQIEKSALEHLDTPQIRLLTHALGSLAELALRALGGVATLVDVATRLDAWIPFGDVHPEAMTRFLVEWCPNVTITTDSLLFVQSYTESLIRQTQQTLRDIVLQQPDIARDNLITQALIAGGEQIVAASTQFVSAVLETTKDIVAHDERYQPLGRGSTTSRVIQAMRSLGRPATVVEIGAEYRRLYPDEGQRKDNSIRGFFDRFHSTFVLVGLSTYALAEWGYDPKINNITALVERILRQSDRPLRREEVVEHALAKYRWKAQSISAQLDTNPCIRRFGNDWFGLRDHHYSEFDVGHAADDDDDDEHIGGTKIPRERLVVGTYTNDRGHRVVQVRLSARCLGGYIPLTSQPIRELLPDVGKFRAEVWPATASCKHLVLSRTIHDISGFRPLFEAVFARAGDALFIERLSASTADTDAHVPMYRLALAHVDDLIKAMGVVGLNTGDNDATTGDMPVLHYTRKPHQLARLIKHAVEHPWMPLTDVNAALNCVPDNPAGREYLRLAQVTGLIAADRSNPLGATTLRPTALGRRWAFSPEGEWDRGRKLALTLPSYRAHLRSLGGMTLTNGHTGAEMRRLGEKVLATWDRICGITPSEPAVHALEESAALISTDLLVGPALPLLLLLLMAQTQGQGISLPALAMMSGGRAQTALLRLRTLGLAISEDNSDNIALAERVQVAVATTGGVGEMLQTSLADVGIASALAQAWSGALRMVGYRRTLRASDLYGELHALAPDVLYGALTTPPAATPEYALDVDMGLPFCGFPSLVADWAISAGADTSPGAGRYQTVIAHANHGGDLTDDAPIGVSLCDDLLRQLWDAERHLAGNAHLALLTLVAADEERLAEHLHRSDDGWWLAGESLVTALDALLRTLGYDVWDERYRSDHEQQTRLGDALVTLAERLNIVVAVGGRLEAVNGIATRMYYEACDHGFIQRLTEALNSSLPLA